MEDLNHLWTVVDDHSTKIAVLDSSVKVLQRDLVDYSAESSAAIRANTEAIRALELNQATNSGIVKALTPIALAVLAIAQALIVYLLIGK